MVNRWTMRIWELLYLELIERTSSYSGDVLKKQNRKKTEYQFNNFLVMTHYIRIIFFLIFICSSFPGNSKQHNKIYELCGNINNAKEGGRVYLTSGFIDSIYYEPTFKQLDTLISKGKFCFNGNISYPNGVILAYGDSVRNYYSDIIFIEPNKMGIEINLDLTNIDFFKDRPFIFNSKSNDEYKNNYLKALSPVAINEKSLVEQQKVLLEKYNGILPDSIKSKFENSFISLRNKKDTILLNYITVHPDSYVGLWVLIQNFCIFGYKQIYFDTFKKFSNSLKATYAGKILANKLTITMISNSNGRPFPSIKVKTTKDTEISVPLAGNGGKYILIDFWASYCAPCIQQFDKLEKIYQQYNKSGFEIIGISIDKIKDKNNWLVLIKEHQLPWEQYWDMDGIKAKKMSINAVPTNYLLDEKGKIITKNISVDELSSFLKQNLK